MFILDLPDIRDTCEKVCFVNPSGLVELWVNKSRFIRYEDSDRLLQYLRRKLGDKTIHKIIPYETDSYSIIRHHLRDVNEFIKVFDDYVEIGNCSRWCNGGGCCESKIIYKHIELFDNLDFIIRFCSVYWDTYHLMPIQFKCNKKLLKTVLIKDQNLIRYAPDSVTYNQDLIIYLIKSSSRDNKPNCIYKYLPHMLRENPEILSTSLNNGCWTDIMHNIVGHIPDNLINNRNFILSLNINTPSALYRFLDRNMQRDYAIILKFGYFNNRDEYNNIMTPTMKLDIELHRTLVCRNPHIFRYMQYELRDSVEIACIYINNIINTKITWDRSFIESTLSARLLNNPYIKSKLSQIRW